MERRVAGVERSEPPETNGLGARCSFLASRPQPPRYRSYFFRVPNSLPSRDFRITPPGPMRCDSGGWTPGMGRQNVRLSYGRLASRSDVIFGCAAAIAGWMGAQT